MVNEAVAQTSVTESEDGSRIFTSEVLTQFEVQLRQWHKTLLGDTSTLLHSIQEETRPEPDHVDRGTIQEEWQTRFTMMYSKEKLLQEIEAALHCINEGTYGYSEISGKLIPLKRLQAWPIARFTVEEEDSQHPGKGFL